MPGAPRLPKYDSKAFFQRGVEVPNERKLRHARAAVQVEKDWIFAVPTPDQQSLLIVPQLLSSKVDTAGNDATRRVPKRGCAPESPAHEHANDDKPTAGFGRESDAANRRRAPCAPARRFDIPRITVATAADRAVSSIASLTPFRVP